MRELLRARDSVQRIDRHPVPAPDRGADAVDDEGVVVRQLDRAEADGVTGRVVERLFPEPVGPPEPRLLDPKHDLPVELDRADASFQTHERHSLRGRIERDRPPDPLVDQARTEVPAVPHPALVDSNSARPADLRLALRSGVHRDGEHVLARRHLDAERRKRSDVVCHLLAVDEHGRLMVDSTELDRAAFDPAAVHPGPRRYPLGEQALALEVGVVQLSRADEVVDDTARHARGQPTRPLPRVVHVPAPLLA